MHPMNNISSLLEQQLKINIAKFLMGSSFVLPWPVLSHEAGPSRPTLAILEAVCGKEAYERGNDIAIKLKFEDWTKGIGENGSLGKPDVPKQTNELIQNKGGSEKQCENNGKTMTKSSLRTSTKRRKEMLW